MRKKRDLEIHSSTERGSLQQIKLDVVKTLVYRDIEVIVGQARVNGPRFHSYSDKKAIFRSPPKPSEKEAIEWAKKVVDNYHLSKEQDAAKRLAQSSPKKRLD